MNLPALGIATYNIHGAIGTDGRLAAQRIAAVLAEIDADIFALEEVPLGGANTPEVLEHLHRATGLQAAEGPTLGTPARRYGNAVLTRFPVRGAHARPVVQESRAAQRARCGYRL